jgi:hypothetical protein
MKEERRETEKKMQKNKFVNKIQRGITQNNAYVTQTTELIFFCNRILSSHNNS